MPISLLSKTEIQNKIEAKVNSYLDEFVDVLLWAGSSMEVLKDGKIVFETPVMYTHNEDYFKVGTLFVDPDTMKIIHEISDNADKILENIENLVTLK